MLSVSDRDIRKAWLASGAIHLAILSIAVILLFRQTPVDTANQFVYLISDSKSNSAVNEHSHKVKQVITKTDNISAMQPAVQVSAVVPVKSVQVQSAVQGTPLIKKESSRELASSGHSLIEASFGDSSGLKFRHHEIPVYPQAARRMNREGRVMLSLIIDDRGKLIKYEVVEGAAFGFTEAAIDAVRKSTFIPARKGGVPVRAKAPLTVSFKLTD
jgi:protein TonB